MKVFVVLAAAAVVAFYALLELARWGARREMRRNEEYGSQVRSGRVRDPREPLSSWVYCAAVFAAFVLAVAGVHHLVGGR